MSNGADNQEEPKGTKAPKAAKASKADAILEILQRPFGKEQIKHRKGRGGQTLDYIEAHSVIERLNEAFGFKWSFEVESHEQVGGEFIVLGKLSVDGVSKMQFGGKQIEVYSKGDRQGEVISSSDNVKAATSDALKKCATLFGVGLGLYGGDTSTKNGGNGKSGKSGTVADVKNRIVAGEKKIKALTEVSAADMRDEHLGSQSLDHPKAKLEEYLAFLLVEYQEASEVEGEPE